MFHLKVVRVASGGGPWGCPNNIRQHHAISLLIYRNSLDTLDHIPHERVMVMVMLNVDLLRSL
jgi:hypothetical protein